MSDQEKIAELTRCVVDALNMPPKRWTGIMGRDGVYKHWVWHFCDSLERCGHNVNRDAVARHHFKSAYKKSDEHLEQFSGVAPGLQQSASIGG